LSRLGSRGPRPIPRAGVQSQPRPFAYSVGCASRVGEKICEQRIDVQQERNEQLQCHWDFKNKQCHKKGSGLPRRPCDTRLPGVSFLADCRSYAHDVDKCNEVSHCIQNPAYEGFCFQDGRHPTFEPEREEGQPCILIVAACIARAQLASSTIGTISRACARPRRIVGGLFISCNSRWPLHLICESADRFLFAVSCPTHGFAPCGPRSLGSRP
jgi:hypothetical protein